MIGMCTYEKYYGHIELLVEKPTHQTPFRLVYGVEVVIPMEYIVPSLLIVASIGMANCGALE